MRTNSTISRLLQGTVLSSAVLAMAAPAVAQDETTTDDTIIVTGSRLPQANLVGASPVNQVNAEEFSYRGVIRVEDLLNDLPQVFASNSAGDANGATGTATVDLRGLGTVRTLVLQNGRRLPAGSPGAGGIAPDLNFIPGGLVERVDVLTGGASATYGSDAVGGVVNFIMQDDFEGFKIDYQYGGYQHNNNNETIQDVVTGAGFQTPSGSTWGGGTHEITAIIGANTGDGRGNVTAYAGYRTVKPVLQSERDYSACALQGTAGSFDCGGSSTIPEGRFTDFGLATAAPGTFPQLLDDDDMPVFEDDGVTPVQDIPGFDFTVDQSSGDFRDFGGGDLYNYGPLNYYQRPDERITLGGFAHYEINRHADVYMEVGFMDDRTVAQIAPSGAFFVTSSLSCGNPFLTSQQFDAVCGDYGLTPSDSQNVFIGRRNVEGGPRQSDLRHTTWRVVTGVRGEIDDNWNYDVYLNYGENSFTNVYRNELSITNIQRALNVVDDGSGNAVCQSVVDGSDPNCVPWNIFTPGGADVTPAALNYLIKPLFARGGTEQTNIVGFVSGDLTSYGFQAPWAEEGVQSAFGFEYREEFLDYEPDTGFTSGDGAGQGGPTNPAQGRLDVYEFFTEWSIPLVQGREFFEDLSLDAGYRYSTYSTDVDTNTYKFALQWRPTEDVMFRGSYQRAVRHANIRELFRPSGIGLFDLDEITISDSGTPDDTSDDITAFDPCAGPMPSATQAQCANTGVTASQYGSIADSPAGQFNALFGGNPNLSPEKSDTFSAGVVLTPAAIPGFNLTVDWYSIDVQDAIGPVDPATILNQCLDSGDPTLCGYINRGVTGNGTLWLGQDNIVATDQNLGFFKTTGIDFNAQYGLDTGYGDLNFHWNATYLMSFEQQQFPGGPVDNCEGIFSSACGAPRPEWTSNLRTTWGAPWGTDISVFWRYLGGVGGPETFDAVNYVDFAAIHPVNENVTLRFGVNNVLDKEPPLTSSAGPSIFGNGNTFPGVYDALGRYVFGGITLNF
ncbi:TonB-dependent receptor plug domain-containing protein [Hyphococcus luteus]|uniref:TonB-dependent receptor n=1 Tax=Hyphococcus luteus TaxID=2058213 RepID=A0A2S7K5U2_9PROT|nr:TonB-dependent receptor [Marinicaulis flavus]PQA87846.1 TonB-dependent receptor [Marinicaulis flavus]